MLSIHSILNSSKEFNVSLSLPEPLSFITKNRSHIMRCVHTDGVTLKADWIIKKDHVPPTYPLEIPQIFEQNNNINHSYISFNIYLENRSQW